MKPADRYLELWRVSKSFQGPQGPVSVVKDFELCVRQGEFVSLIGHSGCGKSTILSIVAGLNSLTSGGIILAGKEIDGAGPDRGVVFQSPSLLPWLTAFQNVLIGVDQVRTGASTSEKAEFVKHYLSLVGLGDAMFKRAGGNVAGDATACGVGPRVRALDPKILLLDEPFGMLDSLTRFELQDVLIELWAQDQKTALMVTHDVDEALLLSDRVVMMTSGPEAHVGEILSVALPRPRVRTELMRHADYHALRERLIGFLESQQHSGEPPATETVAETLCLPPPPNPSPTLDAVRPAEPLLATG